MKRESLVAGILITLLCLYSFSTIAQETGEIGGIRIAYIEIEEDGHCHIGVENVGNQQQTEGELKITINESILKPVNMTISDRDFLSLYKEHQLTLEDSCILTITSVDENDKTTSEVTLDYTRDTYFYIEPENIDGYITTLTLRQPNSINEEEDWLGCCSVTTEKGSNKEDEMLEMR